MDNIIKGLLDTLSLSDGLSVRKDCPYCGGRNTFTLRKERGEVKWNCYKLDCRAKGIENVSMSTVEILAAVKEVGTNHKQILKPLLHWVPPSPKMIKWMKLWGVLSAVEQGRLKAMYDPKEDRYVFLAYHDGRLVAAQGRSSDPQHKIKWKHYYGGIRVPFIIPNKITLKTEHKIGICVEDITSAAVVSDYADGIALMGTNILDGYYPILQKYDKLWVCLDKDATSKAIVMAKELSFYTETKVVLADKDPKNMLQFELDHYFSNL
jgi:hypothetical protein